MEPAACQSGGARRSLTPVPRARYDTGMSAAVPGQNWDPDRYARNARFVAELGMPVVELLAPRPGERILDLGCGDGALTAKLAGLGCRVVGVDASLAQARAARQRGLDVAVVDGHDLPLRPAFDAVFSNAALHWMPHARAVMAGVWRALEPGGRFVAEMGGRGNVAAIRSALYTALDRRGIDAAAIDPWYFPDPDAYAALLREQGFSVLSMELLPRPTPLPGDMAGWLATFAETFTVVLPEADRPAFVAEVCRMLEPGLRAPDGRWVADYVRLRFAALKPSVPTSRIVQRGTD
jgi:trans-aconitate methyltransferase